MDFEAIANEVINRKGVSEVFVTSDGVPFLTEDFAKNHALKNRLRVQKIVKPKKSKK